MGIYLESVRRCYICDSFYHRILTGPNRRKKDATETDDKALHPRPGETRKQFFRRLDAQVGEALNKAKMDTKTLREKRKRYCTKVRKFSWFREASSNLMWMCTDLENLEKLGNLKYISESQVICHKNPKVKEFCCVKLIVCQFEDPNFETFSGEAYPEPPPEQTWTRLKI